MNTTTPLAASTHATPVATRRVIDAPTRMFHWLFALCFVGAYATADGERWRLLHVTLGYTLAGLLGFRVLYGLLGPRQTRLSLLWRKLGGLPNWLRSPQWRQGQNLAMAGAVLLLMALVLPLTLSGYATYNEWGGEWLEEVHEVVGEFFLWTVLAHLALLLGLSLLRRKNQAMPMLTGRVEGNGPDLAQRNHLWLAALVLFSVVGYWAGVGLLAPRGDRAPPASGWAERRHNGDDDD